MLAIMLTAVAHKYSMTSLVPAISYLTALDKYILSSMMLIVLIAFAGSMLGTVESFYCRRTAIWADDINATGAGEYAEYAEYAADQSNHGRRLTARASSATTSTIGELPIAYTDKDCPVDSRNERPNNKFDLIDKIDLAVTFGLWLTIQLWALVRYRGTRNTFDKRVQSIDEKQAHAKALAHEASMKMARRPSQTKVGFAAQVAPSGDSASAAPSPKPKAPPKPGALKRTKTDMIVARMPAKPEVEGVCDEVNEATEAGGMGEVNGGIAAAAMPVPARSPSKLPPLAAPPS